MSNRFIYYLKKALCELEKDKINLAQGGTKATHDWEFWLKKRGRVVFFHKGKIVKPIKTRRQKHGN